jgi:TonB-linked SusC/RagA family outer membrane protein
MNKTVLILLCINWVCIKLSAQTRIVTGSVRDEAGNPLAGATISVVTTTTRTVTNTDGNFSISFPAALHELDVSFVGFTTQRVDVGKQTEVAIKLSRSISSFQDVVVVAYGTVKREELTGSVGVIKAEQLQKRAVSNILNTIEGAIPGVVTSSTNGQPGFGVTVRVRGFGSINATSSPLFVVDGVPYINGTSNITPNDVESITVLKDAAASALYGSRAGNGVVIITTKKGQKGRHNISVKIMQGIVERGLPEYNRLDAFEYYPLLWEAYRNSLVYPSNGSGISLDSANKVASGLTTRTSIKTLLSYNPFNVPDNAIVGTDGKLSSNAQLLYADDLDWTKELYKNNIRQDYSINFNGGSDKSDYFFSLDYYNEPGFLIKTGFKRYSTRLNMNIQPKSWLKTGLNITGNHSIFNQTGDGVAGIYFTRNIGPIYPVYAHNMSTGVFLIDTITGQKIWDTGNMGGVNGVPNRPSAAYPGRHFLAETLLNDNTATRSAISGRSYADITFLKNFKFTANISVDIENQNFNTFDNAIVGSYAGTGNVIKYTTSNRNLTTIQLLNYSNSFSLHKIDGLIAHETFDVFQGEVYVSKQGQTVAGNTELNSFTTTGSLTSNESRNKIESYFSRLNYDYGGKYFVSASIRTDGNSRFAPESRWGTFWSLGASWRLEKEKFVKNVSWINLLKLRSSYGETGVADAISYYAFRGLYNFANNANQPGVIQSQTQALTNRDLTWETNKQFDIAVDLELFRSRLSGSLEYYHRRSDNLLFAVPQPLSSGVSTMWKNTGAMYNKGIELQLNGDIIRAKNFTWNMNINLSTVKNRITTMPATVPEFISGVSKYSVGHSVYDFWLRSYYGVDQADGSALYMAANTSASSTRRLITNKNGNVDTVTTSASNGKFDYQGSAIPDFYGGCTETVRFKQFSVTVLFTFQKGGEIYDADYQGLMSSGTYGAALHTDILKRWQKPGDITDVPRMDAGRVSDFNAASSRWLIDASYINIRTLSAGYNLSKSLMSRFKMNDAQIFISVENAHFFSKRKGMDTQQSFSGVTGNAYPPAKIMNLGISLNL